MPLGAWAAYWLGACYGKPTSLPIGVVYTVGYSGVPTGIPLLPVQAFEGAALLLIFLILAAYTRHGHPPMRVMALYLLLYSPCRFALEFLRYDAIRGAFSLLFHIAMAQYFAGSCWHSAVAFFQSAINSPYDPSVFQCLQVLILALSSKEC